MTNNELNLPASHDIRRFTHRGYQCAVLMGPMTINGYITLPDGHPWLDYPDSLEVHPDIDVHGGITYHVGNTIGFDTNHFRDGHHPRPHTGTCPTVLATSGPGMKSKRKPADSLTKPNRQKPPQKGQLNDQP